MCRTVDQIISYKSDDFNSVTFRCLNCIIFLCIHIDDPYGICVIHACIFMPCQNIIVFIDDIISLCQPGNKLHIFIAVHGHCVDTVSNHKVQKIFFRHIGKFSYTVPEDIKRTIRRYKD